jgi:hypothetical protein
MDNKTILLIKEFYMKNIFKLFGNLNRARSAKVPLLIIALVAVIGFSIVACGDINVPVSGVTLNESSISLTVGGTKTLTATVSPSDATNKAVGWSSSNSNVATVTNGTVTAVTAGSAIITVTTADGGKTAQCTVTVTGSTIPTTQSFNGIWQNSTGTQVTVSGSTGILSTYTGTSLLAQSAIDKGYITVGTTQYWKSITSTGTLTWSGQQQNVQYETSNPNVATGTVYRNCTFTMSADGQTLTVTGTDGSGTTLGTWTRVSSQSLNGIWQSSSGTQVTVSGSTGILSALSSSTNALTQSAIDKGYITVGTTQYWKSITSTGTLTWSGQQQNVQYETSSPNVATGTVYRNCTFTMSADEQTLTVTGTDGSGTTLGTWTRKQ